MSAAEEFSHTTIPMAGCVCIGCITARTNIANERIRELEAQVTAARAILQKFITFCDEADRPIRSVTKIAAVHGVLYDGPTWAEPLREARAYLLAEFDRRGFARGGEE